LILLCCRENKAFFKSIRLFLTLQLLTGQRFIFTGSYVSHMLRTGDYGRIAPVIPRSFTVQSAVLTKINVNLAVRGKKRVEYRF